MPDQRKPKGRDKEFYANKNAEREFALALRRVARQSAHIVEMHTDKHRLYQEGEMMRRLRDYADQLDPWARRQAAKMLERVGQKNKKAWEKNSKEMGKILRSTVAQSDVGRKAASLMQEQVELIKSLPTRAGERAQKLAMEAMYNGSRASEIAKELARSGKVSESDADRIARTEVARANSKLTQARAQAAGSTQYIWRNSQDAAVRDSHRIRDGKKLDGQVFDWASPPTLDDGTTGHPGTFPNCRCYPEPFFPRE